MRRLNIFTLAVLLTGLCGCEAINPESPAVNNAVVQSFGDMAIENAILRQQTLYPYHFEQDGAEPNELGSRELALLACHYKQHAGALKIRQGDAAPELYQARIVKVREMLGDQGVPPENVCIADGLPGGNGMPSEDVLKITIGRNSPTQPLYYEGGGGTSSNGGGQGGMGQSMNGATGGSMQ